MKISTFTVVIITACAAVQIYWMTAIFFGGNTPPTSNKYLEARLAFQQVSFPGRAVPNFPVHLDGKSHLVPHHNTINTRTQHTISRPNTKI